MSSTFFAFILFMCFMPIALLLYSIFSVIKRSKDCTLLNSQTKKWCFLPAALHGVAFFLLWFLSGYAIIISLLTWSTHPLVRLLEPFWSFWWYWFAVAPIVWFWFLWQDRLNKGQNLFLFKSLPLQSLQKWILSIVCFVLIISAISIISSSLGGYISQVITWLYMKSL